MKTVSRFEANLLQLLRFFLRSAPRPEAILGEAMEAPPCLSRNAIDLVQDVLGKGCMLVLAGAGRRHGNGWRPERFLRDGRVAQGRLWERTPPEALGLTFTRQALRFLIWVTAQALPTTRRFNPSPEELGTGDWLLFYFAYAALRDLPAAQGLAPQTPFAGNALCRLAFPQDFADPQPQAMPDFGRWTAGPGGCILEALQDELCECWLAAERNKPNVITGKAQRALGQAQEQVLTAFLDPAEQAGRRDLARFLLAANGEVLAVENPYAWMDGLDLSRERLAERGETHRLVMALPRTLRRLRDWEQQTRSVGYFDEDYAAAQLWKADWEQLRGEALYERAQALVPRSENWR